MLHDNWIEYFMVWTQICLVVHICSEMYKTLLPLKLVVKCFWTFKTTNVSCNKLCVLFTKNRLFNKFQSYELIKHIVHGMWKPKFKKQNFILFSCAF